MRRLPIASPRGDRLLDARLLALGEWIAQYYLAPPGEVYRTRLPLYPQLFEGLSRAV